MLHHKEPLSRAVRRLMDSINGKLEEAHKYTTYQLILELHCTRNLIRRIAKHSDTKEFIEASLDVDLQRLDDIQLLLTQEFVNGE